MEIEKESHIIGDFKGWRKNRIHKLDDGSLWQQTGNRKQHSFFFRPIAKILHIGKNFLLDVEGMNERIAVKKIN